MSHDPSQAPSQEPNAERPDSPEPPQRPNVRTSISLVLIAICLLTSAALYVDRAVSAQYVHDDNPALVDNPLVRFPPPVLDIWTSPWFGTARGFQTQGLSRPLVTFGYALEAGLEMTSGARHLVNLLLYALVCGLVGVMVWLLVGERPWRASAALLSSLLFTLHPIHVSSVMCVSYRPELQAALLAIAASCCLLVGVERRSRWLWLSPPLLLLALWSKESSVTVLGAWVLWVSARRSPRGWRAVISATALCGLWLAVRHSWLGAPWVSFHDNPLGHAPTTTRLMGGLWLIHLAASKLLWPTNLAPDETFNSLPVLSPSTEGVAAGGALLALLVVFALSQWLRGRGGDRDAAGRAVAVAWFGGAWLPVSHLLFPSTVLFADRLLFLPSVAAAAGLGVGLAALMQRGGWRRSLCMLTVLALALPWSLLSRAEAKHWTSERGLFEHGVRQRPNNLRMRYNLGRLLFQSKDYDGARHHLEHARLVAPKDEGVWTTLAQTYTQTGACEKIRQLLSAPPTPTRDRHRKAQVDAGVRCRMFKQAFIAGAGLGRPDGQWPLKVYVAGVAAQHPDAERWAAQFTKGRAPNFIWVSAASYAENLAGRPIAALARLRAAAQSFPRQAAQAGARLCRSSPALRDQCARWPGDSLRP